jgi:hypothetical protein
VSGRLLDRRRGHVLTLDRQALRCPHMQKMTLKNGQDDKNGSSGNEEKFQRWWFFYNKYVHMRHNIFRIKKLNSCIVPSLPPPPRQKVNHEKHYKILIIKCIATFFQMYLNLKCPPLKKKHHFEIRSKMWGGGMLVLLWV